MARSKVIFIGIKGSVLAIDTATGRQLWATHLKSADFVNVVLDGDNLYAATYGELFCLDPATGEGRWHNPLKGLGRGLVSIAAGNEAQSALLTLMAEKRRRDEQAAADASSTAAMGT